MAEHKGFTRLKADLKAEQMQNVYIFYGEETYLRARYLQQVRQLLIPAGFEEFNDHHLSGKGLTVQVLSEVVEAMPMMAQHTLVTVEDMDLFKLDESQRNALIALLEDFPEYCTLIFIYDTLDYKRDGKMKKLCAALDKHVCAVEFAQQERAQLVNWLRRRFTALGHDIDSSAADHLLFTCGTLMTDLVPEIELSSNDLLIDLARIGLGIAFIPDYCLNRESKELFIVKIKEKLPARQMVTAVNPTLPIAQSTEEFLKLLPSLPELG